MRFDLKSVRAISLALGLATAMASASCAAAAATLPEPPVVQAAAPATPEPAPANDERANAQAVHSLPATINGTTVGATLEPGEVESACGVSTAGSVWYSLRAQK